MHLPSLHSIKQSCVPLSGSMYAQIFKTTQQILMRYILIDEMIQEEGLYLQFITLETRAKLRASASLFNNIIRLKSEHFVNDRRNLYRVSHIRTDLSPLAVLKRSGCEACQHNWSTEPVWPRNMKSCTCNIKIKIFAFIFVNYIFFNCSHGKCLK